MTSLLLALCGLVLGTPRPAGADGPTTFANSQAIAIPATGSANQTGPASPYPSPIQVSGMTGAVTKVTVTFHNLSHSTLNDVDAMVVAPSGANLVVLSDIGDPNQLATVANQTLTFDDAAPTAVPAQVNVPGGSYRPTNQGGADVFAAPAPAPSGQTTLAGAFTGLATANGTWNLFVADDATGDIGAMTGGWSLTITTEAAAAPTTTTVTSSDTSSQLGDPVTFTASVRAGGAPVGGGTVQFADGPTNLGAPVPVGPGGTALLTTSALAEGTHTITATFSGITGYLTSNGSVSQRVDRATTVTGNTFCNTGPITTPQVGAASPYPSNIVVSGLSGQITTVTARLTGLSHTAPIDLDVMLSGPDSTTTVMLLSDAGGQNPVSNLTVSLDDEAAGSVPAPLTTGSFRPTDLDPDGQIDTFPAPAPTPGGATELSGFDGTSANGTWSLWVVDDASGDSGSISGGWCLTITSQVATTTTLTSAPNPSTVGQEVALTAAVTAADGSTPTGTVQFRDGATDIGAPVPLVGGLAQLTTTSLLVGSHSVTARFTGTGDLAASDSNLVTQSVQPIPSTTVLTSSPSPSAAGDSVVFTATVTAGSPPLSGTVTFTDGPDLVAVAPLAVDGTASWTTTGLGVGAHTIDAAYSGDARHASSSGSVVHDVGLRPSVTTLVSSRNPAVFGSSVDFTATVLDNGLPASGGTVQFGVGGSPVGSAVAVAPDGTAVLTTDSLAVGDHAVTATYSGANASGLGGSAGSLVQTIDRAPSTTAVTATPSPAPYGTSVTFTAAVTSGASPLTAGTVAFASGATVLCAAAAVQPDGTATCSIDDLTPGSHVVTADYSGSTSHEGGSGTVTHVVTPTADAGGPYETAEGEGVTLDATASSPGATTYLWDLDADGVFGDVAGISPALSWDQLQSFGIDDGGATPTSYPVTLRVTAGSTSVDAATQIVVTNTAPTSVLSGGTTARAGQAFTIKVGADDPSAADLAALFTYTVDWGDGSPVESVIGPADPPVTHTYAAAGQYRAAFTATDKDGGRGGATTITVTATPASTTTTTSPSTTVTSSTTSTTTRATVSGTVRTTAGGTTLAATGAPVGAGILLGCALLALGAALLRLTGRTTRRGAHE